MNNDNILNETLLAEYCDTLGIGTVQQMIDLYKSHVVEYIAEIESAMQNESQNDWRESCHKLKGASSSVGLNSVHQQAAKMEKTQEPFAVRADYFQQLTKFNDQAVNAVGTWLASR